MRPIKIPKRLQSTKTLKKAGGYNVQNVVSIINRMNILFGIVRYK